MSMFFLFSLVKTSDSAAHLTSLTVFVGGNQSRCLFVRLCVNAVLCSTNIHFKEKSYNFYVMLSGHNMKNEVVLSCVTISC